MNEIKFNTLVLPLIVITLEVCVLFCLRLKKSVCAPPLDLRLMGIMIMLIFNMVHGGSVTMESLLRPKWLFPDDK